MPPQSLLDLEKYPHQLDLPQAKDFVEWKADLLNFSRGTNFHGLKILEFVDGAETASVSFSAYLRQGEHDSTFSEKSTFIKQDGRWLYQAGELAS